MTAQKQGFDWVAVISFATIGGVAAWGLISAGYAWKSGYGSEFKWLIRLALAGSTLLILLFASLMAKYFCEGRSPFQERSAQRLI